MAFVPVAAARKVGGVGLREWPSARYDAVDKAAGQRSSGASATTTDSEQYEAPDFATLGRVRPRASRADRAGGSEPVGVPQRAGALPRAAGAGLAPIAIREREESAPHPRVGRRRHHLQVGRPGRGRLRRGGAGPAGQCAAAAVAEPKLRGRQAGSRGQGVVS